MRRMWRRGLWAVVAGVGLCMASQAPAAVFDFNTAGEYAANFTTFTGSATQTTFIRATAGHSSVYDTTPGETGSKDTFTVTQGGPGVTVNVDLRTNSGNNSSLGIYFIDGSDRTKGYLAILNVDTGDGGQENIRFSSNVTPSTGGAENLSTTSAAGAGVDKDSFFPLTVNYSINDAGKGILRLIVGTRDVSSAPIDNPLTNVEIGLRFSPQNGGSVDIDNLEIVPEPASLSLMGLAMAGLLTRRNGRRSVVARA